MLRFKNCFEGCPSTSGFQGFRGLQGLGARRRFEKPVCRGPVRHILLSGSLLCEKFVHMYPTKMLCRKGNFCYKPMSGNGRPSLLQTQCF